MADLEKKVERNSDYIKSGMGEKEWNRIQERLTMKKLSYAVLLLIGFACANEELSPTETAKKVVESFYEKDNTELRNHTTAESYESFLGVQELFTSEEMPEFKLVIDTINSETAWVQFTTNYEEKPETFKLIKENGKWKVTESKIGERSPF